MGKFIKYFTFIFLFFVELVMADVLIIERIQKSGSVIKPSRGLSMSQVTSQFGEPELKKEAIGDPPIIVWKYNEFTVYFENEWVINSVVNKSSSEEKGPKPVNF